MSKIIRVPWSVQPQVPVGIDWGNPLNRASAAIWDVNSLATILIKDGGRYGLHATSVVGAITPTMAVGRLGKCINVPLVSNSSPAGIVVPYCSSFGATYPNLLDIDNTISPYEYTVYGIVEFTSITAAGNDYEAAIFRAAGASGLGVSVSFFPKQKKIRPLIVTSGTSGWTTGNDYTDSRLVDGVPWLVGFTWKAGSFLKLFTGPIFGEVIISARPITPTGNFAPTNQYATYLAGMECSGLYLYKGGIKLYSARVLRRTLADSEIRSISANPWQIFQPVSKPYYLDLGSSGGTTIQGTLGEASALGYDASLNRVIAAQIGTATASGYDAALGSFTTITASLGSATASGFTAALPLTITASLGSATATGYDAALPRTVIATVGTAVAAGYDVSLDGSTTIVATLGTADADGYSTTVTRHLLCTLGTADSPDYQANISVTLNIAASLGTAVADGYIAQVLGELAIGATLGSAQAFGYDATVSTTGILTLTVADLAAIDALIAARIPDIAAAILAAAQAAGGIHADARAIKGKPLGGEGVLGDEFHV